jgi:hypothetical protein
MKGCVVKGCLQFLNFLFVFAGAVSVLLVCFVDTKCGGLCMIENHKRLFLDGRHADRGHLVCCSLTLGVATREMGVISLDCDVNHRFNRNIQAQLSLSGSCREAGTVNLTNVQCSIATRIFKRKCH